MKKINSIHFGGTMIGIGVFISIVLPFIINLITGSWSWIISSIGIAILGLFAIILLIELRQDKKIDRYYDKHRNTRICIRNGLYECSNCGNRQVREKDTHCPICGIHFSDEGVITPNDIINLRHKV